MTVLLALLPALCLLGGAVLYLAPLPLFSRFRNFYPLAAIVLSGAAVLFLARTSSDVLVLFEPSTILPGLTLSLMWNGPALPFGLFL